MIYLDNAATTRIRDEVLLETTAVLRDIYGNPSSMHSLGRTAHNVIEKARKRVLSAVNGDQAREIMFTGCGTESDNIALRGMLPVNSGYHVITSSIEHHAVINTLRYLERNGVEVTYIDPERDGSVDPEKVRRSIKSNTRLISIMFANNETGVLNPVKEIGRIARENDIVFHTDAVQAVGHVRIDVNDMNIDMLSLSGHKFYAPKGVGALYVRDGIRLNKLMTGGAQERTMRPGTENTASIAAMGLAAELSLNELESEADRITRLRNMLIEGIYGSIPDVRLNGGNENRLPGIVNMQFSGVSSDALLLSLDMDGIACSGGAACSAGAQEASHVLLAMGLSETEAKSSLRFSIGRYNTEDEIAETIDSLKRNVERIRSISPLYSS